MSAASICVPSDHVTPSLIRYVIVSGSSESIGARAELVVVDVVEVVVVVARSRRRCRGPSGTAGWRWRSRCRARSSVLNDSSGSFQATRTSPAGSPGSSYGPCGMPQPLPPDDADVLGARPAPSPSVCLGASPARWFCLGVLRWRGRCPRTPCRRTVPSAVRVLPRSHRHRRRRCNAATMSDAAASTDRNFMLLRRLTSSTSCVLCSHCVRRVHLRTGRRCAPGGRAATTGVATGPPDALDPRRSPRRGAHHGTVASACTVEARIVRGTPAFRCERSTRATASTSVSGTGRCGRTRRGRGWPRRRGRRRCRAGPSARRCSPPSPSRRTGCAGRRPSSSSVSSATCERMPPHTAWASSAVAVRPVPIAQIGS